MSIWLSSCCCLQKENTREKSYCVSCAQSLQLFPTLCSTVTHQALLSMGFSRARILEWVSFPFSRGSSWPRDQTHSISCIFCITGRFFNTEPPGKTNCVFSSVQFSCSVVSDSLRPHESQHARPPCPSPSPGVHSNSRPSSQWCHPAISSSVIPFSSCPQFLPASESFPMSQLFAWGGQSTGVSALASFLPKNT